MSGDTPSTSSQKLCGICKDKTSKYCCPRCDIFYCSLDCYKSEQHIQCSENFYRDCVNEELATYQTDEQSKRKMIDILRKLRMQDEEGHFDMPDMAGLGDDDAGDGEDDDLEGLELDDERNDSDDEEQVELHERLKGLDLDNADAVWSALTEDEKNEFEALLGQGDVGSIMPQWEPWWTFSAEEKLVEELSKSKKEEEDAMNRCPALKQVPELTSLTTVKPSSTIKYNIMNVLASYAFISRYFNGDLEPAVSAIYLMHACGNMDAGSNFDDPGLALEDVVQRCLQSDLIETDELSLEVMKHDTFQILQGPSKENRQHYAKAALSHLHQMFTEVKKFNREKEEEAEKSQDVKGTTFAKKFPEHKSEHLPKFDQNKVKKCIKKLEYYLSYIESYGLVFNN